MTVFSRPRVLLIAEAANPEWVSVPLEGWSHGRAIASLVPAHLVTQIRNRDAILRAGLTESDFTAIDSERAARLAWKLAGLLRGGEGKGWTMTTALGAIAYPYFEHLIWKRFGERIRAGEFDVVHRLTPLSPTAPSSLARKCAAAGVPFVLGPLNGGVPWPKGFDFARRREKEWLSYIRGGYRLLPGYRSTRKHAAAIILGSRDTFRQVPPRYHPKCIYIPENAVDPARFSPPSGRPPPPPLRMAFLGRLVPYKGADILLEAVAPLVRAGRAEVEVMGDGPEMPRLRELVAREGLEKGVILSGWVKHHEVQHRLARCHLFTFPSIREFGGAVVLEAMAQGVVPVVVAYGGPMELVSPATGFALPLGSRGELIERFRKTIGLLCDDPGPLDLMGRRARERVLARFTWEAKARQVLEVYRWVLGERAEKPDFGMPLGDEDLKS